MMIGISHRNISAIFKKSTARKLCFNFANYSIFQAINYLIPFITIPYIVRVVGVEKFGIVCFAQALCYYFRVITEYGFSITGVQEIAQHRNNFAKRSEIFTSVISIQIILCLTGFVILYILTIILSEMNEYRLVYLFSYGVVMAYILMSLWFYIGMEEMQYLNYISMFARSVYVILIFLLVKREKDFVLIPLFNSGSLILAGVLSFVFIFMRFKIKIISIRVVTLVNYLKSGLHIFISNFAINLYRNSNVLILGLVADKHAVGIYSAGEKVIKVFQSLFGPITQTVFPYISRQKTIDPRKSIRLIRYLLIIISVVSGFITILIFIFAKPITLFVLGSEFQKVTSIIQIGCFVICLGVINYIVGIIFMTNFDLKREFLRSVIITGLLNILLCFFLSFFWEEIGAAIAFTSAELLLLLIMIFFIRLHREKRAVPIDG